MYFNKYKKYKKKYIELKAGSATGPTLIINEPNINNQNNSSNDPETEFTFNLYNVNLNPEKIAFPRTNAPRVSPNSGQLISDDFIISFLKTKKIKRGVLKLIGLIGLMETFLELNIEQGILGNENRYMVNNKFCQVFFLPCKYYQKNKQYKSWFLSVDNRYLNHTYEEASKYCTNPECLYTWIGQNNSDPNPEIIDIYILNYQDLDRSTFTANPDIDIQNYEDNLKDEFIKHKLNGFQRLES